MHTQHNYIYFKNKRIIIIIKFETVKEASGLTTLHHLHILHTLSHQYNCKQTNNSTNIKNTQKGEKPN